MSVPLVLALPARIAVLASGTGSNMQALAEAGTSGRMPARVVLVISDNPSAPVLERATSLGIETTVLSRTQFSNRQSHEAAIASHLDRVRADLVCLAGYMRLLGADFIQRYEGRILNVHPSLLPAFSGRHGVADALAYGVKLTGCTVHVVDEGVDTGPIILQAAVPVVDEDTVDSVTARIQREEHRLYPEAVRLMCEGRITVVGRRVRTEGLPPMSTGIRL